MAAGVITGPEVEYQLIPIQRGLHRLEEVNPENRLECGGAISPFGSGAPSEGEQGSLLSPSDNGGPAVMDVLAVYTQEARAAATGSDQIQVRIQNSIDFANQAYANSLIEHRVRLVAAAEVGISEEGQTAADLLQAVKLDPSTNSLRDSYGADIVALIADDLGGGIGGYASLMTRHDYGPAFAPDAYSVNALDNLVWILPHEMGHNMGLAHDPERSAVGPEDAVYPFAFGHKLDGVFRSIMAYQCTEFVCPQIQYFSNPDLWHQGTQIGIDGQRDNSQALRNTAPVVALFRTTAVCEAIPPPERFLYPLESAFGKFRISWDPVEGAAIYTLQRSTDSSFSDVVTLYVGTEIQFEEGPLEEGFYHYRVRSENCSHLSTWAMGDKLAVDGTLGEGRISLFPYSLSAGPPFPQDPYSGVALFNPNQHPTDVEFHAHNATGQELQSVLLSEMEGRDLIQPLGQVALLPTEIFSLGNAAAVFVKGTSGPIQHFFMLGDYSLSSLDGVAGPVPLRQRCYLPIARSNSSESTSVFLTNSSAESPAYFSLLLISSDGEQEGSANGFLAPLGTFRGEIGDIFSREDTDGYIRVSSETGVKAFELYSQGEGISAISGQPLKKSTRLIAPHYFVAPGGNTELRLINTGPNDADVMIRGYQDDGTAIGEFSLRLRTRKQFVGLVNEFLPTLGDGSEVASGYLVVATNGVPIGNIATDTSVLGTITFTGFHGKTIASLPCAHTGSRKTRFLHVAQSAELNMFTGLAILNLSGDSASVTLKTYDTEGSLSGEKVVQSLASGTRVVELLNGPNFLGPSFQQIGGNIEVSSDHPVMVFALFGDYSGNFLAAIEGR